MTMYEEPPMVELEELLIDEILDERESAEARATRTQILVVIAGGIVGIAGLLTLLVVTAPSWLDLVRIIAALTSPHAGTP